MAHLSVAFESGFIVGQPTLPTQSNRASVPAAPCDLRDSFSLSFISDSGSYWNTKNNNACCTLRSRGPSIQLMFVRGFDSLTEPKAPTRTCMVLTGFLLFILHYSNQCKEKFLRPTRYLNFYLSARMLHEPPASASSSRRRGVERTRAYKYNLELNNIM